MSARHIAGAPRAASRPLRRRCRDPFARSRGRDRGGDPFGAGTARRVAPRVRRRSGLAARGAAPARDRSRRPGGCDPGGSGPQPRSGRRPQPRFRAGPWPGHLRPGQRCGIRRRRDACTRGRSTGRRPHAGRDRLSHPATRMRCGRSFLLGLSRRPASPRRRVLRHGHLCRRRSRDPPRPHGTATTKHCSSAGKSSTSACAPSSAAGASAIAATSWCVTRSAPSSASPGRAPAGSTSCATGSTSSANGAPGGCGSCRRASRSICSGARATTCWHRPFTP